MGTHNFSLLCKLFINFVCDDVYCDIAIFYFVDFFVTVTARSKMPELE